MSWTLVLELVVSVAFGVLSSVIPVFSCEVFIAAAQIGGLAQEVTTAVGCAVGQAIGKVGMVVLLRRGGDSRLAKRFNERRPRKPAGKLLTRLRGWSDKMLALLSHERWGLPIVFLSSCAYVPPLYAVTLAVPATPIPVIPFGLTVLLGRLVPFLAIAFGISALVN